MLTEREQVQNVSLDDCKRSIELPDFLSIYVCEAVPQRHYRPCHLLRPSPENGAQVTYQQTTKDTMQALQRMKCIKVYLSKH